MSWLDKFLKIVFRATLDALREMACSAEIESIEEIITIHFVTFFLFFPRFRSLRRIRELLASCCRATKIHPLACLKEESVIIDGRRVNIKTIYVQPRDQGMDATSASTNGEC